jgi:hypothetical protein
MNRHKKKRPYTGTDGKGLAKLLYGGDNKVQRTPINNKYQQYTRAKRRIAQMGLSPAEYERRIKELAEQLGI